MLAGVTLYVSGIPSNLTRVCFQLIYPLFISNISLLDLQLKHTDINIGLSIKL